MRVFLYSRMSTDKQDKSPQRQLEMAEEFAERKFSKTIHHVFLDEGISANKDVERPEFEAMKRWGYVEGDVIVTESIDRLSRKGIVEVVPLVDGFRKKGVKLFTIDDGLELTSDGMDVEVLTTIKARIAREYSEKLSARVISGRKSKLKKAIAEGTVYTGMTPHWITTNGNHYEVISERANIVEFIFEQALTNGATAIARMLNERGVPAWSRYLRKATVAKWRADYLKKQILRNRTVLGEVETKQKGVIKLYPAVVSEELFNKVNALMDKRTIVDKYGNRKGRGGRTGKSFSNLVTKIAKCSHCGSPIIYTNKGGKYQYLTCSVKCSASGNLPYADFEKEFLEYCSVAPWREVAVDKTKLNQLESIREALEAKEAEQTKVISNLKKQKRLIDPDEDREMLDEINNDLREERAILDDTIQQIKIVKADIVAELEIVKGITDDNIVNLVGDVQGGDYEVRSKINGELNKRIDSLTINTNNKESIPYYNMTVGDFNEVKYIGKGENITFDDKDFD